MENYYGLVNKPPIDEILNYDLVNKPDILSDEIIHYGTLHMRWGIRRYQNPDGSLTPAGKIRYAKRSHKAERKKELIMQRKEKKEQKAADKQRKREEKFKKNKEKILRDPAKIIKNQDMFTNDELYKAKQRLDNIENIHLANRVKLARGKQYADTLLSYGDTLNKAITFLNSNAGKAIRAQLGMNTNDIWNYDKNNSSGKKKNKNK